MIVTNKNNPVNGNNALVPDFKPSRNTIERKYKELETSKREHKKINKQKRVKKKAIVLKNVLLAFTVGVILVYRYSLIYDMEKNIIDTKKEISAINAENENLRIGLLKFNNIKEIEKISVGQLNMIPKSKTNVVYIDLQKNNFKKVEENKEKGGSFIEKLKKILF
ncbi:hypothetical protein [Clostridium sp. ZS2-4]|uniref:hypothetical protein n=1 Tax=Clostridium sp. ZS2-4 TaxID=2987703 RepID=UPI00227CCE89|nr:hypothetical protein [Clostridium sp. ZS2-4]MCY6354032.1 hypothetical protein [Clostridium sp. ZS2-4]